MENLIVAFVAVAPLCVQMALGYFAKSRKLVNEQTLNQMNNVVFKIFLPILLFINIYKTNSEDIFNPALTIFAVTGTLCAFALAWLFIGLTQRQKDQKGVMIQGIFRSNFILFGLPLSISLFGQSAAGITSLLIAVIVPVFNILAVVILEYYRGEKVNVKQIIKGIVTNPLIISSSLGMILIWLKIPLPGIMTSILSGLSAVATPLALFVLGGTFTFSAIRGNLRQIVICLLGKLVIVPGIFLTVAILFGFRDAELATLVALFASPVAVSSFTMAGQMEGDSTLAGQLVVMGSAFSVVTVFFVIFILKTIGVM